MASPDLEKQISKTLKEIGLAVGHLQYSYEKVKRLPKDKDQLDEEGLESYEGFVSRFARVSDLFLQKYLRTRVVISDPAFRGEFLDVLNKSEKLGLIQSAQVWYEIRQLRNFSVHEYAGEKFTGTIERMIELTPLLIETKNAPNI